MTDDRLGEIRKYATDPMARIAISMAYPAEIVSLLRELLDEIDELRTKKPTPVSVPVVDGQGVTRLVNESTGIGNATGANEP